MKNACSIKKYMNTIIAQEPKLYSFSPPPMKRAESQAFVYGILFIALLMYALTLMLLPETKVRAELSRDWAFMGCYDADRGIVPEVYGEVTAEFRKDRSLEEKTCKDTEYKGGIRECYCDDYNIPRERYIECDEGASGGACLVSNWTADISVVLSTDAASAEVGALIPFTAEIQNNGPYAATNVIYEDRFNSELLEIESAPSNCTFDHKMISCEMGTIPAGGKVSFDYVSKARAVGESVSIATVSGGKNDPIPGNNSSTTLLSIVPVAAADLQLYLTINPAVVTEGEEFAFTFMVYNNGPDDATEVVLNTLVSPLLSLETLPAGCSKNKEVLRCLVGKISAGGIHSIEIKGKATAQGMARNSCDVSSRVPDPNGTGNATSGSLFILEKTESQPSPTSQPDASTLLPEDADITEDSTATPQEYAEMYLTKSVEKVAHEKGEMFFITLSFGNDGSARAEKPILTESYDEKYLSVDQFTLPEGCEAGTGKIICTLPSSLSPGAKGIIKYRVKAIGSGITETTGEITSDTREIISGNNSAVLSLMIDQDFTPPELIIRAKESDGASPSHRIVLDGSKNINMGTFQFNAVGDDIFVDRLAVDIARMNTSTLPGGDVPGDDAMIDSLRILMNDGTPLLSADGKPAVGTRTDENTFLFDTMDLLVRENEEKELILSLDTKSITPLGEVRSGMTAQFLFSCGEAECSAKGMKTGWHLPEENIRMTDEENEKSDPGVSIMLMSNSLKAEKKPSTLSLSSGKNKTLLQFVLKKERPENDAFLRTVVVNVSTFGSVQVENLSLKNEDMETIAFVDEPNIPRGNTYTLTVGENASAATEARSPIDTRNLIRFSLRSSDYYEMIDGEYEAYTLLGEISDVEEESSITTTIFINGEESGTIADGISWRDEGSGSGTDGYLMKWIHDLGSSVTSISNRVK